MAFVVALVLLGLLLVVGLGFAWQERRHLHDPERIYGVEDSIIFVAEGLAETGHDDLNSHDVRRMLEWSVRYLQDPQVRRDPDAPIEFAGDDMGGYIQVQAADQGHLYDGEAIGAVLDLQARYFGAIGALGDAVDDGPGVA